MKSFDVNVQYDKYDWQKRPVLSVTTKTNRAPRPKGTRVRKLNSLKFSSKRSTGKLCYGLKRKRKHSVIQKPKINTRKCEKYQRRTFTFPTDLVPWLSLVKCLLFTISLLFQLFKPHSQERGRHSFFTDLRQS